LLDGKGNLLISDGGNHRIRRLSLRVPDPCSAPGQTRACYTGPATTRGKTPCKDGTQTCQNGVWSTCTGEVLPQFEDCNGIDDDCDGNVDNVTFSRPCAKQTGLCAGAVARCEQGKWQDCTAADYQKTSPAYLDQDTTCDGKDDNCNGLIDEDAKDCVTTIAGSGSPGWRDGPAAQAQFRFPWDIATDGAGTFYVSDELNHRIVKIDTLGNVTTLAGTGTAGYLDGALLQAQFNRPRGLALDGQNLYVAAYYNHCIRKIDLRPSGTISTIAGDCNTDGHKDDTGTQARFWAPAGLALDGIGNLYVAESGNATIRKIELSSGKVTTVAGTFTNGRGVPGFQDGDGAQAKFNGPTFLALDASSNLYVSDYTNHRIRKIDVQSKQVTTLLGDGFCDKSTSFCEPLGLAFDGTSTLYASVDGVLVRKIALPSGSMIPFAGSSYGYQEGRGTSARFYWSKGMALAGNYLYVADSANQRIRKIDLSTADVTTLAGGGSPGRSDGPATSQAMFNIPRSPAVDAKGNIYVGDADNHVIRKVSWISNGQCGTTPSYTGYCVETFAGDGKCDPGKSDCFRDGPAKDSDPAKQAQFRGPYSIAVDKTTPDPTLYAVDHAIIRKIAWVTNEKCETVPSYTGYCVTTIAGSYARQGYIDGPGSQAAFWDLRTVALDSKGILYAVDRGGMIRKIEYLTNGDCQGPGYTGYCVKTIAGSQQRGHRDGPAKQALFDYPGSIAIDAADNIFISDGVYVRKIAWVANGPCGTESGYTGYCVSTVAGADPQGTDWTDGPALQRQIRVPIGGLTIDPQGNLYTAEISRIRTLAWITSGNCAGNPVSTPGYCLTTIAGGNQNFSDERWYRDGPALQAEFVAQTIVWDGKDSLLFTEVYSNRIRRLKVK
jgi:DNA-binding beta-propeller fold protein YncE